MAKQTPENNAQEQSGYFTHQRQLIKLGEARVDLTNEAEVKTRATAFMVLCDRNGVKPTLPGLALAMGLSVQEMAQCPTRTLMRAVQSIEDVTVQMMEDGRIPMAPGIFLLKNWFGYRDVSEVVRSQRAITSTEEIEAKYARIDSIEQSDAKGRKRRLRSGS